MNLLWRVSLGIVLSQVAPGQPPAGPTFETADIHISAPGTWERGGFLPDGRFEYRGVTMLRLIAMAYEVSNDQVVGGPAWLASDRFDITAKAPSRRESHAAMLEMLRHLLAGRFGLTVREEQKDMPVYLLEVANSGPRLHDSANPQTPACPAIDGDPGLNHRACSDYSMADLSKLLPEIARNYVDHPVVDSTGLTGSYDFQLEWMEKSTYLAVKADPAGPPALSMFDALAKLGLKLEPGTHPAQAIAITHVNPSPAEITGKTTPLEFEVAEVRHSNSAARREGLTALPGGQIEILGYTLRDLMTLAFEVNADRVIGGPKWMDVDRFDIIAKSPEVMSPHAVSGMLKTLIVRRFALATHSEDQPVPILALVVRKESPKLRDADGSARSDCGLSLAELGRTYLCRNTTMAELVDRLPHVAQAYLVRPLVDLTGLKGAYDFSLTWTPRGPQPGLSGQVNGGLVQAPAPRGGITLFEAIEKQLGLKIEERKYPMPVIVVDHAERVK